MPKLRAQPGYKLEDTNGQMIVNTVSSLSDEEARRTFDGIQVITANAAEFQRKLYNMFLDKRRKIEVECGYPDTEELTAERYKQIYEREPLAARVVDLFPKGCWQTAPKLFETEDIEDVTPFEEAWENTNKQLQGQGFFEDESTTGTPVWEILERADKLSGIGHYGVILLGIDDGEPLWAPLKLLDDPEIAVAELEEEEQPGNELLSEEALRKQETEFQKVKDAQGPTPEQRQEDEEADDTGTGTEETAGAEEKPFVLPDDEEEGEEVAGPTRKLLFLRPLDETMCGIDKYDTDVTSSRFGMPVMYAVTLENPGHQPANTQVESTRIIKVHWTRIVHLADNLESSEIFGGPRMRVLYNRLYDLFKLYGGSAEMYWLSAFFGISFETHPQMGPEVTIDVAQMRTQIENYQNSLQRWLAMPGMTAKTLSPQVSDPTAQINVQIESICIFLGVPKRIFMGSERGELASGQDARAWYAVLKHRQTSYLTPRVIVPFIDRLIQIGVLPKPESYRVKWEDIASLTDTEIAAIAKSVTESMSAYIAGGVEALMDPLDYFVRVLKFSEEEAKTIIENRMSTPMESEEEVPMLDEDGNPMVDPITGIPIMETVSMGIGQERELGGRPMKDEFGDPVMKEGDEDGAATDDEIEEEGEEFAAIKKEAGGDSSKTKGKGKKGSGSRRSARKKAEATMLEEIERRKKLKGGKK